MLYPKPSAITKLHDFIIESQGGVSGPLQPNLLAAAVERPKTKVYGFEPFENTISKSAALAYGIITFHPFLDGNKRTAVASMILALGQNSIDLAIPPYMVKYTVQVALDPSNRMHTSEDEFTRNIIPFCSTGSMSRRWKHFRYSTIPYTVLRLYFSLMTRLRYRFVLRAVVDRLLDWYAAGDLQTLRNTLQEWSSSVKKGYPRNVPPPELVTGDFETI